MRYRIYVLGVGAVIGGALTAAGCGSQPAATEPSMYDRQNQAMKRPFDYSPTQDFPDISGGGIGDFDPKAFGKDLHDFLNP